MSGLDRLKKASRAAQAGLIWRLILLGLAVLAMALPAAGCLLIGGWLGWLGLAALAVWALLGLWVWQAWRQWVSYGENYFEEYY